MSKITTADCRNFLASDPTVQRIIHERAADAVEIAYSDKVISNGKNPKRWKRITKYKVGSKTDLEGGELGGGMGYSHPDQVKYVIRECGVDPTGGVVRDFWLEETDRVTISLLEKEGQLYFLEDLSD